MSSKQIIIILLILIFLGVICDISIRSFYCSSIHLSFDSQEFNNIASPIIAFLGFIGVIITVLLTLKQIKNQQGSTYVNYYREYINKIAKDTPATNDAFSFSTAELLKFTFYSIDKFEELQKYPEYFSDLEKFKNGENIVSSNKPYDIILGNVRLFAATISILLKQYISLIREIEDHEYLDKTQKLLLLKDLFDSQVTEYYISCKMLDELPDLIEVRDKFYIGFAQLKKENLLFYNEQFYNLKKLIDKRTDLKKFTEG